MQLNVSWTKKSQAVVERRYISKHTIQVTHCSASKRFGILAVNAPDQHPSASVDRDVQFKRFGNKLSEPTVSEYLSSSKLWQPTYS